MPGLVAGLAHSILMLLAFPPFGFWGLAFAAPLPLAWVAIRPGARLAIPVWLGVLPLWAYEMSWVWRVSILGYWPMIAALAAFPVMFAAIVRRASGRIPLSLAAPTAWTGLEFLRGAIICDGFPWMLLGHPTIDMPLVPASASLLGTYFVSFLASAPTGIASDLLARPRRRVLWASGVASAGAAAIAAAGLLRPPLPSGSPIRITVVQTDILQDNKLDWKVEERIRDWARFAELTRRAAEADPRPDLIVWPETMFPGEVLDAESVRAQRDSGLGVPYVGADGQERALALPAFADALDDLQFEIGVPMLVGAMAARNLRFVERDAGSKPEYDARYNAVFLVIGGGVDPLRYDKMSLTPFGEAIPYLDGWPWLRERVKALAAGGMPMDLSAGQSPTVFAVPALDGRTVHVVTPICFEATLSPVCRRLVRGGGARVEVMVNLTNDGWFGSFDAGRWQHLQAARWRCVELGVPMVRAANTGISAQIDARGRLVKAGPDGSAYPSRCEGLLAASVVPGGGPTIYSRIGDVFGWSALAGSVVLAAVGVIGRRAAGAVRGS